MPVPDTRTRRSSMLFIAFPTIFLAKLYCLLLFLSCALSVALSCSEWLVTQHRDTYASYISHQPLLLYLSIADNVSTTRMRYNCFQVFFSPSFPLFLFFLSTLSFYLYLFYFSVFLFITLFVSLLSNRKWSTRAVLLHQKKPWTNKKGSHLYNIACFSRSLLFTDVFLPCFFYTVNVNKSFFFFIWHA